MDDRPVSFDRWPHGGDIPSDAGLLARTDECPGAVEV